MTKLLRALAACIALVLGLVGLRADSPHRINRAIELLADGQPIYYTGSHDGTEGSFEQGVKDAQTWADYISYDMEHAPFDVKGLADYMRGLVKGGPTKSGHRTPAVIVNVPVNGTDEATVRANAWMFQQVLATGVHGILLCHADTPGAVRAFVEAVRFPANGGRRGVHGNPTASRIWGISADDYAEKADAWPLNPKGELLLGLKLEDKYARNAEANASAGSRSPNGIGRHGVPARRQERPGSDAAGDAGGARVLATKGSRSSSSRHAVDYDMVRMIGAGNERLISAEFTQAHAALVGKVG
jgi:hypothetical protein